MSFRVCIPAAGTGSRLGNATKFLNKSLIDVAGKPALARIVEKFPPETEFVIALGWHGGLIREFLSLAWPARKFILVEVDPFDGRGSGLGLSLQMCEPYLRQPFVFISCDTLVDDPIPGPERNWAGWAGAAKAENYRSLLIKDGHVTAILEKGEKGQNQKPYIGLAGIRDYEAFWNAMHSPDALERGEAAGLAGVLSCGARIGARAFNWHDTGTPENLSAARAHYTEPGAPVILPKPDEAIWFMNGTVIKFSANEKFIEERVARAGAIKDFVPAISDHTAHMYAYRKAAGKVLSRCASPELFKKLLEFCGNFWKPARLEPEETVRFRARCMKFYKDKTLARISKFYEVFAKNDAETVVNGRLLPPLEKLLAQLDWNMLADGEPGVFHGDFHFENILWDAENDNFIFLDWRQNFAGNLHVGDQYYDFAKLLHGLIICHGLIAKDLYRVSWEGNIIEYDFLRKNVLVKCEDLFKRWLERKAYSWKKTRILTALIYLNIAALHHYPYSLLLYAIGKDMLAEETIM